MYLAKDPDLHLFEVFERHRGGLGEDRIGEIGNERFRRLLLKFLFPLSVLWHFLPG